MDPITIVVLVVLGAAVLAVVFSPDPLSSAIRARIPWLQRKAANAVDSVEVRTAAAQAAQANTVRFGRRSLYQVKQDLAASQIDLDRASQELKEDDTAMALAHQQNDRVGFNKLVAEKNRDLAVHTQLTAAHQQLVNELKTLEVAVDETREKQREIETQSRVMNAQARVADVSTSVYEAQAGLNENGAQSQMDAAQKILDKKMAKANAARDSAGGMTPGERDDRITANYLKQARQGTVGGVSADDLWTQMSQNSAASSSTPAA